MRSTLSVAVVALAMLLAMAQAAGGQEAEAPEPAAAATSTVGLPEAPVPYTKLRPRTPARRATPRAAAPPSAAPAQTSLPGEAPVIASLPTTSSGARLAPEQPLPPAELEAFVDGLVRDAMGREHVAGVTVSVVQDGQVVLKKGYGFADLEPRRAVDPDRTLFRIGSISKTFTWIALMKEVEAGRIRLNQPVNLYLPQKVQIRDQGYDAPVRVAHLMDHSAGFEDRALGHLFERSFDRVRPLELYLRQERPRRVRPAGQVSTYSNYGVALAGRAIAYTSGKPFEQLIEDEILRPMGMTRTTFREPHPEKRGIPAPMPPELVRHISEGYRWTPAGFRQRPYEYIGQVAPAGSASSTAGDMARYMLMLLNDGQLGEARVFGPRTAQAFRTPLRPSPAGVNGWAHGFQVFELPGGHRGFGHGGATLSFMSSMVVVPALDLGIFISTNTESGQSLAARFPERLVQQFYAPPQVFPRPGSPELLRRQGAYEGYYLTSRRTYGGLEGFVGQLIGGVSVGVTPEGRLITVGGGQTQTWVPEGPLSTGRFVAAYGAERMVFTLEDGRARRFLPASGAARLERAPLWNEPITLAVLAALTAAAALATLGGLALRNRREFRQTLIQARASLVQNIQAGLWLTAMVLFGLWASKTGDIAQVMYRWPGALLITASACALVAAVLTLATLAALPAVWRGGRRLDSWTHLRKAFFTVTALVYTAFSVLLAMWGALSPWSG